MKSKSCSFASLRVVVCVTVVILITLAPEVVVEGCYVEAGLFLVDVTRIK